MGKQTHRSPAGPQGCGARAGETEAAGRVQYRDVDSTMCLRARGTAAQRRRREEHVLAPEMDTKASDGPPFPFPGSDSLSLLGPNSTLAICVQQIQDMTGQPSLLRP